MTASLRSCALAGTVITASLAVWLLASARVALMQGNASADVLVQATSALPMTQLVALIAIGFPATQQLPMASRLGNLAVLAAAPAPLAAMLFAMGTPLAGLLAGQLAVAAAVVTVAAAGAVTDQLSPGNWRWRTPCLQLVGLALLWTAAGLVSARL